MKLKVILVFDDWRDKHDLTKSVYNSKVGVELSMSTFHHGTTFQGTIEVDKDDERFLRGVLKDGWCPTFILMDPETKHWRWR